MDDLLASCRDDVARMADELFAFLPPTEGAFALLVGEVEARVAAELARRRPPVAPPACGPGCAACCTINVGALAVEGAAAAAFLRTALPSAEAPRRAEALLEFHARVRWLEDAERIRLRLACPFLDARGACSIHPVRPLACRAVSSLDAGDCRRALDERCDDEAGGLVAMDLLQRALYETALAALVEALAARGLDARRRDVSGMAGAFLADPGLAAAFAGGARVPLE
jgi:Fe-S-cluster containining protein